MLENFVPRNSLLVTRYLDSTRRRGVQESAVIPQRVQSAFDVDSRRGSKIAFVDPNRRLDVGLGHAQIEVEIGNGGLCAREACKEDGVGCGNRPSLAHGGTCRCGQSAQSNSKRWTRHPPAVLRCRNPSTAARMTRLIGRPIAEAAHSPCRVCQLHHSISRRWGLNLAYPPRLMPDCASAMT